MAFKGAFAAGFTKSLGSGIKQGFEERSRQHDKYLDNMIGSAKALAPKYAASKAAAENGVVQMDNLVRDFGLTKSEVVALAQTGDFSTTYETLYQERDKLVAQGLNPGLLSPATIMKSVQIPKSAKMEGTPEDALRFILGGFTANLAKDPTNKSESHVNGSFGQSVAKALMANPKASAEETAAAMQVAGISVSELNNWSARQNSPRQPYAGVTSTGNLVVEGTDYKGTDYAKTSNDFTQRIGSNLYVVDPVTNIPNYTVALGEGKEADAAAAQERKQAVILAGANFAKLEKGLVQQGYTQGFNFRANRDPLLLEIRNSLQTPSDVEAFNAAMSEGTLLKSVLEAGPDGLSDDEVQDILYPKPEEEGKGSGNTPSVIKTTVLEPAGTGVVEETAVAAVVPQTAAERLAAKALGGAVEAAGVTGKAKFKPATMAATELNTPAIQKALSTVSTVVGPEVAAVLATGFQPDTLGFTELNTPAIQQALTVVDEKVGPEVAAIIAGGFKPATMTATELNTPAIKKAIAKIPAKNRASGQSVIDAYLTDGVKFKNEAEAKAWIEKKFNGFNISKNIVKSLATVLYNDSNK